jgi:hypothetical protein
MISHLKGCVAVVLFVAICLLPVLAIADSPKADGREAALSALAEEYWTKRLIEKDYKFTYEKELEKDSLSFSEYVEQAKATEKFKFSSIKTSKVEIKDDKGSVYLTLKAEGPPFRTSMETMLQDMWIYESGAWKHKFTDR